MKECILYLESEDYTLSSVNSSGRTYTKNEYTVDLHQMDNKKEICSIHVNYADYPKQHQNCGIWLSKGYANVKCLKRALELTSEHMNNLVNKIKEQ